MPASSIIRLFVSSTFGDLEAERDALQRDVFPRLKQFCQARGVRFQAIDLRWGVSEEAQRDNRTMRICLGELRRCSHVLILLGDRYGWRPLPETIPAELFENLAGNAPLLGEWYRVDENAVPRIAELQPRGQTESWETSVERPLLATLGHARELTDQDIAIGPSATEQEITHGVLRIAGAASHVRAFHRTLDGDGVPAAYIDPDPQSRLRLDALKDRIEHHLGSANVHRYRVRWHHGTISARDLDAFSKQVLDALTAMVETSLAELAPADASDEDAHRRFEDERNHHLVGRAEPLRRIAAYLRSPATTPLLLGGPSGCGKSAVMARAAREAAAANPGARIVARYIGVTPESSDLVQLLRGLVTAIRRAYPLLKQNQEPVPVAIEPLLGAFYEALQRPTAADPLFLFLDALDQLTSSHDAQALRWLPAKLPEHVRLVVSTAEGATATRTSRLEAAVRVDLAPLTAADGERMLSHWLAETGRTLQDAQRAAVLDAFAIEGRALWLRTAAAEAALLESWRPPPRFDPTMDGLLRQVLDRLSHGGEHGPKLVFHTLRYLAAAREGLAEEEIVEVLGADAEVMDDFRRRSPESPRAVLLPTAVWVRLHGDLEVFLTEHRTHGESLLGFYHRSFREAATAGDESTEWHRRLARYFRAASTGAAPSTWNRAVPRALAELPFHLLEAGEYTALRALYTDMTYIDARCRSLTRDHGFLALLRDLREAAIALVALDRDSGEPVAAMLEVLVERNAMLARFAENAAQEIANYIAGHSRSAASAAVAAAARKIPARLALRHAAAPDGARGHSARITALATLPGGHRFMSGAEDGTVGFWAVGEHDPTWIAAAHEERVTSIAIAPGGGSAVTAGEDGAILLWDLALASRRPFRPLGPHASSAWIAGFIDDESIIASTAGVLFTLDLGSGTELWRGPHSIKAMAAAPDGRAVCARTAGSHEVTLHPLDGRPAIRIAELQRPPSNILFAGRGAVILVADNQGYVFAYSWSGDLVSEALFQPRLRSWCAMDDGAVVAADLAGCLFHISPRLETRRIAPERTGFESPTALAPLPSGRVLAGHEDGAITLIDLTADVVGQRWPAAMSLATGTLTPDGGAIGVAGTWLQGEHVRGRALHLVSPAARATRITSPHSHFITGVANFGGGLLTVDDGGTAIVWRRGRPVREHRLGRELTCCGAWTDGDVGVAGTARNELYLIGRGRAVRRIDLPVLTGSGGVSAVAAAGRPPQFIAALNNSEVLGAGVRAWRAKSGTGMGTAAAVDADRHLAATGHGFGSVHVWSSLTGDELWKNLLHAGPVRALAFGADGLLYSAGADRSVLAIDPESGRVLAATALPAAPVALRVGAGEVLVLDSAGGLSLFSGDAAASGGRWLTFIRNAFH